MGEPNAASARLPISECISVFYGYIVGREAEHKLHRIAKSALTAVTMTRLYVVALILCSLLAVSSASAKRARTRLKIGKNKRRSLCYDMSSSL